MSPLNEDSSHKSPKSSGNNPKEDVGKQITALTINWVPISKSVIVLKFLAGFLCKSQERWRDSGQKLNNSCFTDCIWKSHFSHTLAIEIHSPKSFHAINDQTMHLQLVQTVQHSPYKFQNNTESCTFISMDPVLLTHLVILNIQHWSGSCT